MENAMIPRLVPSVLTALFLSLISAALPAFACERDYTEEAAYWAKVYRSLEREYEDKIVFDPLYGRVRATPGVNFWGPQVVHIAILEEDLEEEEIRSGQYNSVNFPLYCGYMVVDQNHNITFIKKTDLPIAKVMLFMDLLEPYPSTQGNDFIKFSLYIIAKRNSVQGFHGLYGMDFVPMFAHSYLLGQRPKDVEKHELLRLKNYWLHPVDYGFPARREPLQWQYKF